MRGVNPFYMYYTIQEFSLWNTEVRLSVFLFSLRPVQANIDILRLQSITVCSICGKALRHVSDLVVQDTEAQA